MDAIVGMGESRGMPNSILLLFSYATEFLSRRLCFNCLLVLLLVIIEFARKLLPFDVGLLFLADKELLNEGNGE